MTETVGIIGSGTGTPTVKPATTPAPTPATGSTNFQSHVTTPLAAQDPGISPTRFVVDPSAGLVTQYLNHRGDVQSQVPSSVVIAYLRAGLTADGLSKHSSAPPTTPTTTVA